MILATCPKCRGRFQAPETFANKRVKCPKCQTLFTVPSPKPTSAKSSDIAAERSGETIETTSSLSDRPSSLRMLVGCGIAGILFLAFGLTVGLVIYFSINPADQAENKDMAPGPRTEGEEPSRLFGVRRPNRGFPESPHPVEVVSKPLAKMDRLTLEVAPRQEDDAPAPEVWTGHTASIRGVAFTDDGRFVVSVSGAIEKVRLRKEDNSIRVWDARRGKQLRKLDNFPEALGAVSVSPGGRFAVFGHGGHYERDRWIDSVDHRVHLWDIQDNKEIYFRKNSLGGSIGQAEARFAGLDSSVFSTAFAPNREKVVGVDNSGKLVVWETQSGQSWISGKIEAVARQRDDAGLLIPVSFTLSGTNCIRFTPDGRRLLTAGGDYTMRLYDSDTGRQLHNFDSHQDIVWAVDVMRTREGRLLALSGGGSRQRVRGIGFVPGARDYAIRLWDLDSYREIRRFVGHEEDVKSLAFRPNGRHFLSAGMDKTVRLWDVASGKLLRTYRGHTDAIRSVAVSPDGRAAVSCGDDCTIRYWQLPATVEDVILALNKKSRADLTAAMRDLDKMGPELRAAFPQLAQTLCQDDKAMGELALTILCQIGQPDKEWVNGLRELLTSPLPAARLFAAKALAQLGTDALPALAELRKILRDADPAVRLKAVAALANLGKDARQAANDLKELFQNAQDPTLLTAVMDALAAIGGLERSMVEQLLTSRGLQHADAAVRCKALESLRQLGLDTLPIKTLVELRLEDANSEVQDRAAKLLDERMDHLSGADVKDVRALLGMAEKPKAVQIGLQAVKRLGSKAKEVLPELLERLPAAKGKSKLGIALALAAIDAKDRKIAKSISPVLVAALRPETEKEQPNEAVLTAIAALGEAAVSDIFKALEAADDIGAINANNRKAIYLALERLGRVAYSESNIQLLREYRRKERYRDVQEAAGKAMKAMLSP